MENRKPLSKKGLVFFIIIIGIVIFYFLIGKDLLFIAKAYWWEYGYEYVLSKDTFGGKTPEETLSLFITAVKEGNFLLASKYFFEDNSKCNFAREKAFNGLQLLREKDELNKIISLVESSIPNLEGGKEVANLDFGEMEVRNSQEKFSLGSIGIVFNQYGGVWKIKSFSLMQPLLFID